MPVSDHDRRKMASIARDCAEIETDEELTGEALEREIERANSWRAEHGIPPLLEEEPIPELGFHERARALGLIRRRG